jgi:type IV pilus assembly protein PilM
MSLFTKSSVGVEISAAGVTMVTLSGKPDHPRLDGWQGGIFPPETLRLSYREPNVTNPAPFVATIKETFLRLLSSTSRISLSLPDAAGKVMFVDLETRFKSRQEGLDIIRWKLKRMLPMDVSDAHLDYQIVSTRDTGEMNALVTIISRQVISQYEDLIVDAGLQPTVINFTGFSLSKHIIRRTEVSDCSAFIAFVGNVLSIQIFSEGVLQFYRTKDFSEPALDHSKLYREITSSFLVYRESSAGQKVKEVFILVNPDDLELFRQLIGEATDIDPLPVDLERLVERKPGLIADRKVLYQLSASIGAGTRNL